MGEKSCSLRVVCMTILCKVGVIIGHKSHAAQISTIVKEKSDSYLDFSSQDKCSLIMLAPSSTIFYLEKKVLGFFYISKRLGFGQSLRCVRVI